MEFAHFLHRLLAAIFGAACWITNNSFPRTIGDSPIASQTPPPPASTPTIISVEDMFNSSNRLSSTSISTDLSLWESPSPQPVWIPQTLNLLLVLLIALCISLVAYAFFKHVAQPYHQGIPLAPTSRDMSTQTTTPQPPPSVPQPGPQVPHAPIACGLCELLLDQVGHLMRQALPNQKLEANLCSSEAMRARAFERLGEEAARADRAEKALLTPTAPPAAYADGQTQTASEDHTPSRASQALISATQKEISTSRAEIEALKERVKKLSGGEILESRISKAEESLKAGAAERESMVAVATAEVAELKREISRGVADWQTAAAEYQRTLGEREREVTWLTFNLAADRRRRQESDAEYRCLLGVVIGERDVLEREASQLKADLQGERTIRQQIIDGDVAAKTADLQQQLLASQMSAHQALDRNDQLLAWNGFAPVADEGQYDQLPTIVPAEASVVDTEMAHAGAQAFQGEPQPPYYVPGGMVAQANDGPLETTSDPVWSPAPGFWQNQLPDATMAEPPTSQTWTDEENLSFDFGAPDMQLDVEQGAPEYQGVIDPALQVDDPQLANIDPALLMQGQQVGTNLSRQHSHSSSDLSEMSDDALEALGNQTATTAGGAVEEDDWEAKMLEDFARYNEEDDRLAAERKLQNQQKANRLAKRTRVQEGKNNPFLAARPRLQPKKGTRPDGFVPDPTNQGPANENWG